MWNKKCILMEMLRFLNVLLVRGQKLNLIQEESVIFALRKDYGTDTCFYGRVSDGDDTDKHIFKSTVGQKHHAV